MNNKLKIIIAACICIGGGYGVGAAISTQAADSTTPGSIDDPVVTKSYVDQILAQGGTGGGGNSATAALEIVTVPSGKVLIASEEGTEFIVRAGKAMAFSADKDGISDLTEGKDITDGKAISNNHLIVSPRVGRGILPDPAVNGNQLIIMVRGGHEVK